MKSQAAVFGGVVLSCLFMCSSSADSNCLLNTNPILIDVLVPPLNLSVPINVAANVLCTEGTCVNVYTTVVKGLTLQIYLCLLKILDTSCTLLRVYVQLNEVCVLDLGLGGATYCLGVPLHIDTPLLAPTNCSST